MDLEKKEKIEIDGFISNGIQYDLDAKVMEDNRSAVFGIVKDSCGDPIKDAVVKLIEVVCEFGKDERRPVSHTFTDRDGEFVFGPLCPKKKYEIKIWANKVEHVKFCKVSHHNGKCLKGANLDCNEKCETEPENCECDTSIEINDIVIEK